MLTPARFVVAAGRYRTGSTLQYNLIGSYVEHLGIGKRLGLVDPDDVDAMLAEYGHRSGFVGVAKSHHAAAGVGSFVQPTRWADLVRSRLAVPITTTRDQADQRRSMSKKFGIPESELSSSVYWVADVANSRAWAELGSFQQAYDDLLNTPRTALRDLCTHLSIAWSDSAADNAIHDSDLRNVLASISVLEPGTYHPVSLLHWDHIGEETAGTTGE